MPFAKSPGARLHWERHGDDGPALVLSTGQAVPASLWGELISLLAPRFRLVTYDQRGIGESEALSESCTMEDAADDLQAVIGAAFGDEPVISLGHASGGWVAAVHAINHPEAARALVLCSVVGIFARRRACRSRACASTRTGRVRGVQGAAWPALHRHGLRRHARG